MRSQTWNCLFLRAIITICLTMVILLPVGANALGQGCETSELIGTQSVAYHRSQGGVPFIIAESSGASAVQVQTQSGFVQLPLASLLSDDPEWIWSSQGSIAVGATETFVMRFTIPEGFCPRSGCLELSADDEAVFYINGFGPFHHKDADGKPIGAPSGRDEFTALKIEPTWLVCGENTLEVTVTNQHGSTAACVWAMELVLDRCEGAWVVVAEGSQSQGLVSDGDVIDVSADISPMLLYAYWTGVGSGTCDEGVLLRVFDTEWGDLVHEEACSFGPSGECYFQLEPDHNGDGRGDCQRAELVPLCGDCPGDDKFVFSLDSGCRCPTAPSVNCEILSTDKVLLSYIPEGGTTTQFTLCDVDQSFELDVDTALWDCIACDEVAVQEEAEDCERSLSWELQREILGSLQPVKSGSNSGQSVTASFSGSEAVYQLDVDVLCGTALCHESTFRFELKEEAAECSCQGFAASATVAWADVQGTQQLTALSCESETPAQLKICPGTPIYLSADASWDCDSTSTCPGSCARSFQWAVTKGSQLVAQGSLLPPGGLNVTLKSLTPGLYVLELKAKCGSAACPGCRTFRFEVIGDDGACLCGGKGYAVTDPTGVTMEMPLLYGSGVNTGSSGHIFYGQTGQTYTIDLGTLCTGCCPPPCVWYLSKTSWYDALPTQLLDTGPCCDSTDCLVEVTVPDYCVTFSAKDPNGPFHCGTNECLEHAGTIILCPCECGSSQQLAVGTGGTTVTTSCSAPGNAVTSVSLTWNPGEDVTVAHDYSCSNGGCSSTLSDMVWKAVNAETAQVIDMGTCSSNPCLITFVPEMSAISPDDAADAYVYFFPGCGGIPCPECFLQLEFDVP